MEGQSFAIAGLLDNRETKNFSKIPFIGDVPVLGKFFQSVNKTRSNTELMVIVTPEIVNPMPAGSPLLGPKFPEDFLPSNSNMPMTTPQTAATGANPPTATMPVEKLIQSMKPEQELQINTLSPGAVYSGPQSGSTSAAPSQ